MVDVILGLQWGDEGKGKIADFLTPKYNLVARFQGGPNAGHSLEFNGSKFVLNTIPSGIFHENCTNLIGNGVVIDPVRLREEINRTIKGAPNISNNLYISQKAHLILPTHRVLDVASEASKGQDKIGSTLRGIGPTYKDKFGRSGLRIGDITTPKFRKKYDEIKETHLKLIDFLGYTDFDLPAMEEEFFEALDFLKQFKSVSSEYMINQAIQKGEMVLAEGAQGSMLDIDFGSYPFVTSSNTTSGGVCTGLGIAPNAVGVVRGIFKAYCTRVGSGPFPTELEDETGERLRKLGNEFGATTGRPRRTGWLDLVALRYSIMLSGVKELIMMKSDVLSGFNEIKVAISYKIGDIETDQMPFDLCAANVLPVYKSFPGWSENISVCRKWDELPQTFKNYLEFVESFVGIPIKIISVGPDREQTILK